MWKLIEQINWKEISATNYDTESVKRTVMQTFTEKTCKEMRAFAQARHADLYHTIEAYQQENACRVGEYGGDDSFGDMLWHVVGLGEAKFNEVVNDPTALNGMNYVECFGYVMPYDDDYEKMSADYHKEQALRCIKELTRIMDENEPSYTDLMVIKELMRSLVLMLAGEFKEAGKGYTKDNYSSFYQFQSNDCSALFVNVITTAKRYMV